jgi:hypothetical protein
MVIKRDFSQNAKDSKLGVVSSKINLVSTLKNLRQPIIFEELKSLDVELQNFKGNPTRDFTLLDNIKNVVQKAQRMAAEVVLEDNVGYKKQDKKAEIKPFFSYYLRTILKDLTYSRTFRILALYNVRSR